MRWQKRRVRSDGVWLSARDSGGEGRALLLIHGLGLTQRSWARVASRLGDRFRVVTYDQRGHGGSSRAPEYFPSAFLKDLETVVRELGLEDAVLVGHSLGAHLAVEYAARYPNCPGVVAVEGGVPVELPQADWALMDARGRRVLLRTVMAAQRLLRVGSALAYEEMKRLAEENDPCVRGAGKGVRSHLLSRPAGHGIKGRSDPSGREIHDAGRRGVRALQETHPEVQVEWLPCGHFVPLERPGELATLIGRFVGSLP